MEQQGLAKDIACYHGVVSLMASQIGHYEDVVRVPAGRRSRDLPLWLHATLLYRWHLSHMKLSRRRCLTP